MAIKLYVTGLLAVASCVSRPTAPPLVPASSYWYDSVDQLDRVLGDEEPGYSYARYASPTVTAFEEAVAALELVDTFLQEAPPMLNELRHALAAKDADKFRRTAHSTRALENRACWGHSLRDAVTEKRFDSST